MSDDLVVYPMEKVVGIIADEQVLASAGRALSAQDVDATRIEVLHGRDGEVALDPEGDERGPLATALRKVQKALGEEATRLQQLNAAVEAGQFVIQVSLSEDRDDAAAYDAEKHRIGDALLTVGATKVAFYGKNMIEELQLGA